MKKLRSNSFLLLVILLIILNFLVGSCNKDKLDSKYASSFQHKWELKSISKRNTVFGSYIGPWDIKPMTPGYFYRDFRTDGTFSYINGGNAFYSGTYYFLKDSVVIYPHPATVGIPYSTPDTAIIRYIDNNLLVSYSRKIFSSSNYSTMDEEIDSLIR